MIVIAILTILAVLILVAINPFKRLAQARDSQRKSDLGVIARTLDAYYIEHQAYPDPGADLFSESIDGGDWIPGIAPDYIKKLPSDPKQAGLISQLAVLLQNFGVKKQSTGEVAGLSDTGNESFEDTFPPSGWTTGGNANWVQDTNNAQSGTKSAASGLIGNSQRTYLKVSVTVSSSSNLTFYWKVSSESNYDYLYYCVDNDVCTKGFGFSSRISGTVNWTQVTVPLVVGTHSILWAYEKDSSVWSGLDKGWIDNVSLPLAALPTPSPVPSPSPSLVPTPTPTPVPTPTPTPIPTPTPAPSPSPTPTPAPSAAPSIPPDPTPSLSPSSSPQPSGAPVSYKYRYQVTDSNRQSFILWAYLENDDDPEINTKTATAKCQETSPSEDYNYCIKR